MEKPVGFSHSVVPFLLCERVLHNEKSGASKTGLLSLLDYKRFGSPPGIHDPQEGLGTPYMGLLDHQGWASPEWDLEAGQKELLMTGTHT